ncbi:class I SAM-dependent methyltransferase [Streptosporangium sp. NPDC004379]|uniref:class I SAM-dependent methyltransferase n=1 Tax=Streptosporangium sp. NPDC004379 TaxID=3366189 RepID=UPI00369AA4EE
MVDAEMLAYYEHGLEQNRLASGGRQIEFLRVWDLLERHLPPAPARVLDVGGGAGAYALPLAAAGYEVHLIDPVPLHIEQAEAASRVASVPLTSAAVGDARALEAAACSMDAALLLGPLYHLTNRDDRITALREARRVVRPGGVVVAKALSRFYPLFEDIARGTPIGPGGSEENVRFLTDGQYRNPSGDPAQFTTSFFHRPQDLTEEVEEAGLELRVLVGASGSVKLLPEFAQRLEEPEQRERVLAVLRLLETEPSILGMSQNFVAITQVPVEG